MEMQTPGVLGLTCQVKPSHNKLARVWKRPPDRSVYSQQANKSPPRTCGNSHTNVTGLGYTPLHCNTLQCKSPALNLGEVFIIETLITLRGP